jgi:hypothetical protein
MSISVHLELISSQIPGKSSGILQATTSHRTSLISAQWETLMRQGPAIATVAHNKDSGGGASERTPFLPPPKKRKKHAHLLVPYVVFYIEIVGCKFTKSSPHL